jgi:hypothetical protein
MLMAMLESSSRHSGCGRLCHTGGCPGLLPAADPWSAAKWFAEAEKLEQLAEETKASNVFDDMEITDQTLRLSLQVWEPTCSSQHPSKPPLHLCT